MRSLKAGSLRGRVIVVTGAGRGFCAGADFERLQGIQPGEAGEPDKRPHSFPTTIRKPIIAAVNGACAGLGMVYALMCDLVFTAAEAKWTTAFSRRGLIAEYGMAWVLPRLIGQARALDLLLSGRTFTGAEAHELGMANRVAPAETLLAETLAYAKDLAVHSSPASMSGWTAPVSGSTQIASTPTKLPAAQGRRHQAPGLERLGQDPGRLLPRSRPADDRLLRPPRLRRGRVQLPGAPPTTLPSTRRLRSRWSR